MSTENHLESDDSDSSPQSALQEFYSSEFPVSCFNCLNDKVIGPVVKFKEGETPKVVVPFCQRTFLGLRYFYRDTQATIEGEGLKCNDFDCPYNANNPSRG